MNFPFFTMGGKQFWEDVFYYQKWRIQRHFKTKKYRLLDNWDICRAKGTFEECRQAFVKYIEIFEIPRQKGKLVVLLHSLGETKNVFKSLWKSLAQNGYNVAAINYPSTRKSLEGHIDQLNFFLTHTEDADEVSFITKGSACLLLRKLFEQKAPWQEKLKIGKIINVNPINCGGNAYAFLSKFKVFNFILGQSLKDCTPEFTTDIKKLPKELPLGLIFCETYTEKLFRPIVKRYKSIDIKGDLKETDFSAQNVYISNKHLNPFDNPEVLEKCLKFLDEEHF